MKKIVGIIAALALASAVFAKDMPQNVTPEVTKWGGKASLEYQINLDDKAFGMHNDESADFEIQFVSEKEEGCTGDGVWGEVKVKVGGVKVAGGAEAFDVPKASVTTAVIHIIEGDFKLDMDIKVPGLSVGGGDIDIATYSPKSFPKGELTLDGKQGFTLKFGIDKVADFGLQFADNGVVAKDKKFAFVFDVTLKAVENLNFYAGAGFTTAGNKFVAAAKLDYKLGVGDKMYVKPAVGFALDAEKAKTLNAGVLFGWGDAKREPGFAKFNDGFDNVCNNCWDGVSVYAGVPLQKDPEIELLVGLYDQTFVPGLKFGAQLLAKNVAKFSDGNWAADAAAAYSNTFSDWKCSANFGLEAQKQKGASKVETGFLWGASVENASLIDNTNLYVKYAGSKAGKIKTLDGKVSGKDEKGTIKIGAEISF